jgi:hypothetical protein
MTDRTPKYYLLHTTAAPRCNPAPMTRGEAEAVADLIRRDRRGRMGCGRLDHIDVYQQRTPGSPWSVRVRFKGGVLYECGNTRRIVGKPTYYVHHITFTDGTTVNAARPMTREQETTR